MYPTDKSAVFLTQGSALRKAVQSGLEHFLFFHILGTIIPVDFHIFQRGWNHQPDTHFEWQRSHKPPSFAANFPKPVFFLWQSISQGIVADYGDWTCKIVIYGIPWDEHVTNTCDTWESVWRLSVKLARILFLNKKHLECAIPSPVFRHMQICTFPMLVQCFTCAWCLWVMCITLN